MKKDCPVCGTSEGVREYLYGEPAAEPDPAKFISGGCCISADSPNFRCIRCSIDFYEDSDKFHNRFISDGSGMTITCGSCRESMPLLQGLNSHVCQGKVDPWRDY